MTAVLEESVAALLEHFPRRKQNSPTDWHVPCPAHDDDVEDPGKFSLHVTISGDHIVLFCFAGCSTPDVLRAMNLPAAALFLNGRNGHPASPRERPPTLAEFASLKQIKLSLLEADGWTSGPAGIEIPYRQRDGAIWRVQHRRSLQPGAGFTWDNQKGRPLIPYGRHRLDQVMEKGELWLVEGASDAMTALLRGLPCLGLPGSKTTNALAAEDLVGIETLWIVREPGDGGAHFVAGLQARLRELEWTGAAHVVTLPAKDLSDLHVLKPAEFWPALKAAQAAAGPLLGEPSPRAESPTAVELTALMARDYPEDRGLVGGGILVRRGLTVAGGAAKLGKSSLVINLVLQRARSLPWLGFATQPGTTLVCQSEIPEPELQKRLGIMLKDVAAPPEGAAYFLTDRRIKLDRPDGLALLRAQIERVKPDLLVIDPLARFMVGDENSTRDMGAIIAVLDLLIQEHGLAVLLVHHVGKPSKPGEGREGGNRLRGSSALFAAADSVLMLDRADDGFKLAFELRHAPEPAPIYLTRTAALWFTPAGPPADLLAVAYLVASGPLRWGQFVKAIQADCGAPKRTAERLLDRTKKADLVAPDADGYYSATATYRQLRSGGEVSV